MADPSPVAPAQQAMTGPMLDPAVLQSLLGTLMQGQISGLSQADLNQQNASIHSQAQQAADQHTTIELQRLFLYSERFLVHPELGV